ncbi:MAG TPA: metallophosphoesterase [Patescibacteria group bacterium]|nr:metallophosphoesterase [Patescibacteria group bacterium]
MNLLSVLSIGYITIALILIAIFFRDQRKKEYYLGRHRTMAWILISLFSLSVLTAVYARFIEPWRLVTTVTTLDIREITDLKVALITDPQVGNHKKDKWMEQIVKRIDELKPDLVLFGGDMIDNEGTPPDEAKYLGPLQKLVGKYSMYYVLGNHEYGLSRKTITEEQRRTGNRSAEVIKKMEKIGIPLLKNNLVCPEIKSQKICVFGLDDLWGGQPNFDELEEWDQSLPVLFLVHNPDGILYWPENMKKSDLTLAGHTHGGQVWLPFIGPGGDAEIDLPDNFYRGLNFYQDVPVYTSVGSGESGGPLRFMAVPEVVLLYLK